MADLDALSAAREAQSDARGRILLGLALLVLTPLALVGWALVTDAALWFATVVSAVPVGIWARELVHGVLEYKSATQRVLVLRAQPQLRPGQEPLPAARLIDR